MQITLNKNKTIYVLHRVSPIDVALSIRHLAVMLDSGLALEDCIEVLSKQSPDPMLRDAYRSILFDVRTGKTTSSGMRKFPKIFSNIVVSIVEVGERGGTLEKNLNFLSIFLKKKYELSRKVKGAMFYPLIILVLTFAEMLGVVFFILPRMDSLFSAFEDPPRLTMIVLSVSKFLRSNIIVISIITAVLIYLLYRFMKTKKGQDTLDKLLIKIPIIKELVIKNILATISRTLGILLESGIPLADALVITGSTIGNVVYEDIFKIIQSEVQKGQNISYVLERYPNHFPALYIKMIQVGENTATLEDNLLYLYDFYADEVEEMSDNMSTIIEPLLLIFIGLMVALLAISVVGPIYQLTGNVNKL